MKNTLTDLNNHLFAQLERLGNEDLTADGLKFESERTKCISSIARETIANMRLGLEAQLSIHDIPAQQMLPHYLQ